MSNFYNSEPPTSGKVILKTTAGDFDIELWPKEAPKAVRNFVQLCLEGYYDGCIFHRVLENFIAQTGDPTGSGSGGESIYGDPFKDEFHSRLRFIHRGLVACANENRPHSNGSQFFFTLDRSEQLDRKNTIFGTVTGESIYNLANLNQLETDEHDRPKASPIITGADVIWNPFEDIEPRTTPEERLARAAAQKEAEENARKQQRSQRRAQKTLLSFGEGEEEEEEGEEAEAGSDSPAAAHRQLGGVPSSIRSAHDLSGDGRLLQDDTEDARMVAAREAAADEERRKMQASVRDALSKKREAEGDGPEAPVSNGEAEGAEGFAARMRSAAVAKRKALEPPPKFDAKRQAVSPADDRGPLDYEDEDEDDDDDDDDDDQKGKGGLVERHRQQQLATLAARTAAIKPSSQVQGQHMDLLDAAAAGGPHLTDQALRCTDSDVLQGPVCV